MVQSSSINSTRLARMKDLNKTSKWRHYLLSTLALLIMLHFGIRITATTTSAAATTTTTTTTDKPSLEDLAKPAEPSWGDIRRQDVPEAPADKKAFVTELLTMLHEQQVAEQLPQSDVTLGERRSHLPGQLGAGPKMMHQLLEAIGAEGDVRRLFDWIRNSFSPTAIPEVLTQFIVSKLGSVNCPALLKPDKEESLMPRFLLFNDHFVDVPFELSDSPNMNECVTNGKFDPARETIVLVHGYLTGYTLVDGLTNIKNRLLSLNKALNERAINKFAFDASSRPVNGSSSYVYTEDLDSKLRHQMYNVILVDWFNGANPTPRANYIRSAVNTQVVGQFIARFLSALITKCATPASNIHIIAHSLGCHVTGFTGKAMNAAGHRVGKITHLDPVGLCFGRLFSQPKYRLSPDDALETEAVHVSLNLFDNPLDGAHTNFLVNGGRDQAGCGGPSELTNSTTSSVALLFDPAAKFGACSHLRALSLFEEDHSSEPGQCQMVAYRCQNYDRFLAGKCGFCDATNAQCRLMGLQPFHLRFKRLHLGQSPGQITRSHSNDLQPSSTANSQTANRTDPDRNARKVRTVASRDQPATRAPLSSSAGMFGAPSYIAGSGEPMSRRSERRLSSDTREKIVQALERLREDTRSALVGGLSNLRTSPVKDMVELDREKEATGSTTEAPTPHSTPRHENIVTTTPTSVEPGAEISSRTRHDHPDHSPVGSQKLPWGALNGPQYFVGTSAVASYCVNYYQFRVLVAESRLEKIIKNNGLGSNRLAPQLSQHRGGIITAAATLQQRVANASGRDMLHLTVKLLDAAGHFFKGFSLLEHARSMTRVMSDFASHAALGGGPAAGLNEPMMELTMLLNSTRPKPQKISEAIVSYYFHQIVLADRIEINYMSNISPDVRAKFSSVLCPVAINDKHQLVKYVECKKVPPLS